MKLMIDNQKRFVMCFVFEEKTAFNYSFLSSCVMQGIKYKQKRNSQNNNNNKRFVIVAFDWVKLCSPKHTNITIDSLNSELTTIARILDKCFKKNFL